MESLIGLGKAGCNVVSLLKKHPVYNDFYIDVGSKGDRCINLEDYSKTEDYEENPPDLSLHLSKINRKVHFFMAGSGKISGASLATLQQIKERDLDVTYMRPDLDSIGTIGFRRERVVFNVLQQFARSGLLTNLTLIENSSLEAILGDVPIIGYYERLNSLLATTYHMLNVFKHSAPLMGSPEERSDIARISTMGLLDVETGEEKLFYPMERITEKTLYFAFNEEKLKTDGTLVKKIKEIMKKKLDTGVKTNYNVYATQYKTDYGYSVARTSVIQGEDYNG
jgi:hypothetical protein